MFRQAGCNRWVWNQVWHMNQHRLDNKLPLIRYQEANWFLGLWKASEQYSFLREAHSQPLQQTLKDLDRAYKDGFDKAQPLKRMPRRKKKSIHNSFRYPQGVKLDNRRFYLPKIGWVGFFKSQSIVGEIKNTTISYQAGHWYASVQVEYEADILPHEKTDAVGIDMGITNFAALSTEAFINPINALRQQEKKLARAQRLLSRKVKFSSNWLKQKQHISKIHHQIACTRRDYLHKASNDISKNHAMIIIEDLKVRNMSASAKGDITQPGRNVKAKSGLNKSILDQGWFEFRRQLEYKSQWLGGFVMAIPPQHTSQECSVCGHIHKDNRQSQAEFECVGCGHKEHADINAAKVIKARGLCVLACGEDALATSVKQELVGRREAIPPVTAGAVMESSSL